VEFCPKCKSIMIYQGDIAVCRKCGYEKNAEDNSELITVTRRNEGEIPVIEGEGIKTLPTTEAVCPECGNREAFWWMRQLRSADESEVRFFRCTRCGKTWREYD